ncbi:MAG: hypothetical protein QXT77_09040 [Candidatus Methanomethylicaceae archaeon]
MMEEQLAELISLMQELLHWLDFHWELILLGLKVTLAILVAVWIRRKLSRLFIGI